jgi:hypothetical protein
LFAISTAISLAARPAFVVNLVGRYVLVAKQFFDLHDVHTGVEQERAREECGVYTHSITLLPCGNSLSRSALGSLLLKYSFRMVHMVRGSMAVGAPG